MQHALGLQGARNPCLARRDGVGAGQEPAARFTLGNRFERMQHAAIGNHHMRAARRRDFRRLDFGTHTAARQFRRRTTRHRLDFRRDPRNDGDELGVRVIGWRGGIEAVNIGEQNEKIGTCHCGHARGEAIIVAIADFIGRNRVIFIDDGKRF